MNDADIDAVAARLEASTPKEAAQIDLQYGQDVDGIRLVANRAGLMRLALECLKAATAPLPAGREVVQADWKYLFVQGSGAFSQISRTDAVVLPKPAPLTRADKLRNFAAVVVTLAVIAFLFASTMVGCVSIISRISSLWR